MYFHVGTEDWKEESPAYMNIKWLMTTIKKAIRVIRLGATQVGTNLSKN